jgi:hypothetical protein
VLGDTVAIEAPAPGPAAVVLTRTCASALGEGHCWLLAEAPPGWRWLAVVEQRGEEGLVVSLRARSRRESTVAQRELVFAQKDEALQRWASVGAVIAALVAAEPPEPPPPPPVRPAPRRPATPLRRRATPPPPPQAYHAGFDAGAFAVPGLLQDTPRLGGLLRGFVGSELPLLAVAEMRVAQGLHHLQLLWYSAALGLGARVGQWQSTFALEGTAQLVLEGLRISVREPGGSDEAARTRWGGRLSLIGVGRATDQLSFFGGVELNALTPPIRVEVAVTTAGREPIASFAAQAGLRLRGF